MYGFLSEDEAARRIGATEIRFIIIIISLDACEEVFLRSAHSFDTKQKMSEDT